jgi:hypothetical protein
MSVEIVFSGLCSFLNLNNINNTMPEPSVILVRTDLKIVHAHTDEHGEVVDDVASLIHDKHIPFLAFDSTKVLVSDARGFQRASRIDPNFWFRKLDGVLLTILDLKTGYPTINQNYSRVVSKDAYWYEAKDQWNREFVPVRNDRPKKSAVHAFLPFGGGKIRSARLSRVQWKFASPGKPVHIDYFAEEVIYSDFVQTDTRLMIEIADLETRAPISTLTFMAREDRTDGQKDLITVFIGNNTEQGMKEGFERKTDPTAQPHDGAHIVFLNQVADVNVRASAPLPVPVPKPDKPQLPQPGHEPGSGGPSAGFCGPGNANG